MEDLIQQLRENIQDLTGERDSLENELQRQIEAMNNMESKKNKIIQ